MNPTNVLVATNLLLDLLMKAQVVSVALQRAHSEGRDLTDDEMKQFVAGDDAARARLQAAIDAKTTATAVAVV